MTTDTEDTQTVNTAHVFMEDKNLDFFFLYQQGVY